MDERHYKIYFYFVHSNDKDDEEINSEEEDENVGDDEERGTGRKGPPKRKLEMAEYPNLMAKRFAAFQPYRDTALQKWYDKTRLTMGKTNKVTRTQILNEVFTPKLKMYMFHSD